MRSSPELWAPLDLPKVEVEAPPIPAPALDWLPELDFAPPPADPVPAPAGAAGYADGFADGMREGAAVAEREVSAAVEALGKVAAVLQGSQEEFARERERHLVALALAVARKLVQRELSAEPAIVQSLVTRALERLPLDTTLEVRMHPLDLEALGEDRSRLVPPGRGLAIQWNADPTLGRGDFVVESPQRVVDGRLDVALQALYERMTDV